MNTRETIAHNTGGYLVYSVRSAAQLVINDINAREGKIYPGHLAHGTATRDEFFIVASMLRNAINLMGGVRAGAVSVTVEETYCDDPDNDDRPITRNVTYEFTGRRNSPCVIVRDIADRIIHTGAQIISIK